MAKLSLFNKALQAARKANAAAAKKAKTAKAALLKAERKAATRVGTATKPGVRTIKTKGGSRAISKATGQRAAVAPLASRGRKIVYGGGAAGAVAGGTLVARNKIKKAEADAKKARAEAAAAAKRADAAEKRASAASEKGSFRKRRAARLKKRIAKPEGSEERKKIQRTRLKRVMKRMADGGIVKMQGGGLSQAQQNMLRQAQEYAASSGQNPAKLQALTRQHGDLYGQRQQSRAASQMAGSQPGRTSVRNIGPGMKKGGTVPKPRQGGIRGMRGLKSGGAVKKKSGGAAKKMQGGGRAGMSDRSIPAHERMASGEPIQWQQGPVGERRRMDYRNYVTPGVAKRQLSRQAAAGGPGRKAANIGGGGWKKGGAVKRKSKPRGVGIAKRGFGRASR